MTDMLNELFTEKCQVVAGFGPVNMMTGANNGDWVNMEDYARCAVVFFKGAGTAGDDPTLTLQQATDNASAGAKGLNFTRVDVKQGTLTAVAQYTTVAQAAASTYTDATSAEVAAIWIIDVPADSLDRNNGFKYLRANVADIGTNAQIGALLYILHEPRYKSASLPGALS